MSQVSETEEDSNPLIGAFCSPEDAIICQRIVNALKQAHLNIVLTMERTENIIDEMEKTSVVVLFISKEFSESELFVWVLTISSMEGKPFLPIIVETNFEPVGWFGFQLAGHVYVRWNNNEQDFTRFINNTKTRIDELLPVKIPTASNNDILAKFDLIISQLDDHVGVSKADVDKICQSICESIEACEREQNDPTTLFPVAVEIFLKYNIIMNEINENFIELKENIGKEIIQFLDRTIQNVGEHDPLVNDHKRAQETFTRIFNSLATFPTTIYFLNDDFMMNKSHQAHILFWGARVLSLTCAKSIFYSERDAAKFPDQQIVLQMWLKYIDKNIQLSCYSNLVKVLLGILHNLSANVSLVPIFVDACFPSTILSWLSQKLWNINKTMTFNALCMIYNYARHDKGAEALNSLGAIQLLTERRPILAKLIDKPESSIMFDITLALLCEPENINDQTLKIETILKELLSKTLLASQNSKLIYGSLPLREFFLAFNILFINEEAIRRTLKQTIDDKPIDTNFFSNLLLNTSDLDALAQILLLNVIYRMTSLENIQHQLDQNQLFINKLNDLKNRNSQNIALPRYTASMDTAINGILRNIGKMETSPKMEAELKKAFHSYSISTKKKVMISYTHENSGFCKALVDQLKKNPQINVWVDYEQLTEVNDDSHEHIVRAMQLADKVICILTKDYFASGPCKSELGYAVKRLKLIETNALIPIHIGKKYKPPDNWDYQLINIQYLRFNDYPGFDSRIRPPDNDQSFIEIIEKLQHRIVADEKIQSDVNDANRDDNDNIKRVAAPTIFFSQWRKEHIDQWLASIPVPYQLTKLCIFTNTKDLLEYACDLRDHEDANYIDMKERFIEEYKFPLKRKDFLLFRDAFKQLLHNNQSENQPENNSVQSAVCTLL